MRSTAIAVAFRLAISASLAVSGVIHAYLYVNGYRDIPTITARTVAPIRATGHPRIDGLPASTEVLENP